jgi:hypothetical protein
MKTQNQNDKATARPEGFTLKLAGRILTWCLTEPRRGPEQKAELAMVIESELNENTKAIEALRLMVGLFDDEGNFCERYEGQLEHALEVADAVPALGVFVAEPFKEKSERAALVAVADAWAKFKAFYFDDLAKSNPGFLGKLTLQDYGAMNEAYLAVQKADAQLAAVLGK